MSRLDIIKLRVDKFDLFFCFEEYRMVIRIGMFLSKDIVVIENREIIIKLSIFFENMYIVD